MEISLALNFSGTGNKHMDLGTSTHYKLLGDLTTSFSVKDDGGGGNKNVILAIERGAGESEEENAVLYLEVIGANPAVLSYVHEHNDGANQQHTFVDAKLTVNTWHHIAVTRDSNAKKHV